jgi:hypothetical protein
MNKEVKISKRKSVFVELKDWCVMSMGPGQKDKGHFLEVTEWANGEGYDVHTYDDSGERTMQLTYGQFDAIKKCIKAIEKSYETKSI